MRSASFEISHFDQAIKSSVSKLGDKHIKEITSLQRKVTLGILKERDTFACLPTGYGKHLGVVYENGQAFFFLWRHSLPKSRENSEFYTCRPRFLSNCVISWFNSDMRIKYDRTCQRSIKIISIDKTFALHKSAQKKHFFLEFFLKESS